MAAYRIYSADMCLKTSDLLNRVIHIDVNPLLSRTGIDETPQGIDKVLSQLI